MEDAGTFSAARLQILPWVFERETLQSSSLCLSPQNEPSGRESASSLAGRKRLDRTCRGEASRQCVLPCESAAPPSGWRPCRSACTWRASRLSEGKRDKVRERQREGDRQTDRQKGKVKRRSDSIGDWLEMKMFTSELFKQPIKLWVKKRS